MIANAKAPPWGSRQGQWFAEVGFEVQPDGTLVRVTQGRALIPPRSFKGATGAFYKDWR